MKYSYKKIPQIIKSIINSYDEIDLCILFGSVVTNRINKNSDVDIAVSGKKELNLELLVEIQIKLSKKLECNVDLLDMYRLNGVILKKIITDGKILIKKNTGLLADYIKKVIYFNSDMMPNYRYILKQRAERFIHGH